MRKELLIISFILIIINLSAGEKYLVETSVGNFEVELYRDVAPKTVKSFKYLVKKGFYDGVSFHRVINDFMIQTGDPLTLDDDPTNDGTGGAGYKLKEEINAKGLNLSNTLVKNSYYGKMYPEDHPVQSITLQLLFEKEGYKYKDDLVPLAHDYGVLSMANEGPNTGSSQFFIVTNKDGAHWLDGRHTTFGKVISGFETIDLIQKVKTDKNDHPLNKIILKSITTIND
jgi:peptidyl-prolyl cis-trans isomerase A (cyclophilin A)/peptidyl-prolyl cis-trans isomerase-like 1